MHSNGSGVQNRVEILRPQCASWDRFAANGTSELLRGSVAARAYENRRAGSRERKGSRARRSTRTEHKHSASTQLDPTFERAQDADVVGITTVQRPVAAHRTGVHCPNVGGKRLAIFQMLEDGLFVRN